MGSAAQRPRAGGEKAGGRGGPSERGGRREREGISPVAKRRTGPGPAAASRAYSHSPDPAPPAASSAARRLPPPPPPHALPLRARPPPARGGCREPQSGRPSELIGWQRRADYNSQRAPRNGVTSFPSPPLPAPGATERARLPAGRGGVTGSGRKMAAATFAGPWRRPPPVPPRCGPSFLPHCPALPPPREGSEAAEQPVAGGPPPGRPFPPGPWQHRPRP